MRVLLDTDVILDLVLAREPFVEQAAALWLAHERGTITAFVSPITPVNVFYIVRKVKGVKIARQAVIELLAGLRSCSLDHDALQVAAALDVADFEDAVQVAAASLIGADAIVTRNVDDYRGVPIEVLTPGDLVTRLASAPSNDAG